MVGSVLSVLPYLMMVLFSILAGWAADYLYGPKGGWSRRAVRILVQVPVANMVAAVIFVGIGFVTNVAVAVVLMTIAVGVGGVVCASAADRTRDLQNSPRLATSTHAVPPRLRL